MLFPVSESVVPLIFRVMGQRPKIVAVTSKGDNVPCADQSNCASIRSHESGKVSHTVFGLVSRIQVSLGFFSSFSMLMRFRSSTMPLGFGSPSPSMSPSQTSPSPSWSVSVCDGL